MLTRKQRDLLLFIHEKLGEDDISPSFEEMKEALQLKSKSGIHRLITALVERGYLVRLPHRARALEIKRLPEGFRPLSRNDSDNSNVTQFVSKNVGADACSSNSLSALNDIPLYGRIAAGTPIEAISMDGPSIQVPQSMLGRGEHYALSVDGDSMVKAGINDKDTVIIKRCDTAENGTIVVALVDDMEVTLKRLRRAGNKIVLEPENDAYEPRILEPVRVKIQGKLVGLLRTYH